MVDQKCSVITTFSREFKSESLANRAISELAYAAQEGIVANTTVNPDDGTAVVKATLKCHLSNDGKCLLQSLSGAGLKFPNKLHEECLQRQSA